MQYNSDFVPGGFAYMFIDGHITPLKVTAVEFVDPVICGCGNPFAVAVHVTMPDNKIQVFLPEQVPVFPNVEGVLETLLPEGFVGMKVVLSGEAIPSVPAAAPAPAEATDSGTAPAAPVAASKTGAKTSPRTDPKTPVQKKASDVSAPQQPGGSSYVGSGEGFVPPEYNFDNEQRF